MAFIVQERILDCGCPFCLVASGRKQSQHETELKPNFMYKQKLRDACTMIQHNMESGEGKMKIFLVIMRQIYPVWKCMVEILLGGWDGLLAALVLFMAADYVTEILVVILNRKVSREIGFLGFAKKITMFLLVAVGNVIDTLIFQKEGVIRTAVVLFYLSFEGTLILENTAIIGLPVPQELIDVLKWMRDKVMRE